MALITIRETLITSLGGASHSLKPTQAIRNVPVAATILLLIITVLRCEPSRARLRALLGSAHGARCDRDHRLAGSRGRPRLRIKSFRAMSMDLVAGAGFEPATSGL